MPQYPPFRSPDSNYPFNTALLNSSFGPQRVIVFPNGQTFPIGRIFPDSVDSGSVTYTDLFPIPMIPPLSATDAQGVSTTYTISGNTFTWPGGTNTILAQDGTLIVVFPSGTILGIDTVGLLQQALINVGIQGAVAGAASLVTSLGLAPAIEGLITGQSGAVPLTSLGTQGLNPPALTAAAGFPIGKGYVPSLNLLPTKQISALFTEGGTLEAANAIGKTAQTVGQASNDILETVASVTRTVLYMNQIQVGVTNINKNKNKNQDKKPGCISDFSFSVPGIRVCTVPPVIVKSGDGQLSFPGQPPAGAWAASEAALGMQGALTALTPPTGPFLPTFVDGTMLPMLRVFDAFTFSNPALYDKSFTGAPWFVPPELSLSWPGKNSTTYNQLFQGTLGFAFSNDLLGNPTGIAVSGKYPRGAGGLRIALTAEGFAVSQFPMPSISQVHWLQCTGDSSRARLQEFLILGGSGATSHLTTEQVQQKVVLGNRIWWTLDNEGSLVDPFYDTFKTDPFGNTSATAQAGGNGKFFVDVPVTNVKGLVNTFAVWLAWYLQADRKTPSNVPISLLAPVFNPGGYVFIANWYGIDWFAAPGDPNNLVGAWNNAVGSDAAYNPPPFRVCTNRFFRNDFIVSQLSANTLFVPQSELTASNNAIVSILQCLGGSAGSPTPINATPPINFTPVAISRWGWAYQYSTGGPDPNNQPLNPMLFPLNS